MPEDRTGDLITERNMAADSAIADGATIGPTAPLDDPLLSALGRRIRLLRTEAQLSQVALAEAAGMRKQFLNRIESGRQNVCVRTLSKIAGGLGLPLSSLFQ